MTARTIASYLDRHTPQLPNMPAPIDKTYARFKVWRGSVGADPKTQPIDRQKAAHWWHCFRRYNVQGIHQKGRHGVRFTHAIARVYEVLVNDLLNHNRGACWPSLETIARKAGVCVRTVQRAIVQLKRMCVLDWVRRVRYSGEPGLVEQDSNFYWLRPPQDWIGFHYTPTPTPTPDTWGAPDKLHTVMDIARDRQREGAAPGSREVLGIMASDPGSGSVGALGAAIARVDSLFRRRSQ